MVNIYTAVLFKSRLLDEEYHTYSKKGPKDLRNHVYLPHLIRRAKLDFEFP